MERITLSVAKFLSMNIRAELLKGNNGYYGTVYQSVHTPSKACPPWCGCI